MARTLLVLEEAIAMLETIGASKETVRRFKLQAEGALKGKARGQAPDDPNDAITVSSGFGQASRRGFVEFTLNDQLTQMDAAKAREVGLMLLEAAEAATSDELFVKLLERVGITDPERVGRILLDLRELRHGTRGIAWPS